MTRFGLLTLLALSGCFHTTSGDEGNADFTWTSCLLGCTLSSHSMAAGGGVASIRVTLHAGQPAIGSVASSDTNVVTFARDPQDAARVIATAGQPGSADLILKDSTGAEIDRSRVSVKATTELAYDKGWADPGPPTVLAGKNDDLHTTTKNGSEVLIGTGAVKFTPSGTLKKGTGIVFGDSFAFTGTAGQGAIAADCTDAHITVPVAFVDATAITEVAPSVQTLTFAKTVKGTVDVTVKAGTTPVFDALCTWTSTPMGLTFDRSTGGTIGTAAAQTWQISGPVGGYTATCKVDGGLSTTVMVTIN